MKHLLLFFLQLCLIGTLLLWLWLLWQTWNPALVFVPSAVVSVGFTVLPARRQPDPLGCLDACFTLSRLAACFMVVFVVPHLIQWLSLLPTAAGLGGPPVPPSVFDLIIQGATQFCCWAMALLVALMAATKLPWGERWLERLLWFPEERRRP